MSKRIEWIDIAKGIGIILVIFGHIISPSNFRTWIYSFHIPLFFLLVDMYSMKISNLRIL